MHKDLQNIIFFYIVHTEYIVSQILQRANINKQLLKLLIVILTIVHVLCTYVYIK